ncbi:MAG: peptide ABC transporter substrate-binding protein [Bdellovibrionota bacterium]
MGSFKLHIVLSALAWCLFLAATTSAGALTFRLPADPSTLDWNLAHTSHDTHIIINIMEGLVEADQGLTPRGALAERWEISGDGKTYTFHLRKGVKWSDGKPLKTSDFSDSWLRLLDPKTRAPSAKYLFDIENAENYHSGKLKDVSKIGVRAVNDATLEIKLRKPSPYFLQILTYWATFPIRLDLIKKHGSDWCSPRNVVTLGPYILSEWKKTSFIKLKKNPFYHGITANNPLNVEMVIEPDDKKARDLFETGKLDFLLDATTDDITRAKGKIESGAVKISHFPYLATYYLGFNVRSNKLSDPNIRKALAAVIDRDSIAATLQGGQSAAHVFVPPALSVNASGLAPQRWSLYEARAAFAKAGFIEGRGFPKVTMWMARYDGAKNLSSFLVSSLREKLGINAEPHIGTPAEYEDAFNKNKVDMFVGLWGADFPDPANFYEIFASDSRANRTGWASKEYDALLAKAADTSDIPARWQAYASAERILIEKDAVIVPLFYKRITVLLGPRIDELSISPLNYLFIKLIRLKR